MNNINDNISVAVGDASASFMMAGDGSSTNPNDSADLQKSHHKRLSQILRYLATMHRDGTSSECFVRDFPNLNDAKQALVREFCLDGAAAADAAAPADIGESSVLFSLRDFQIASASDISLFPSPPFSFYAASADASAAASSPLASASAFWGKRNHHSTAGSYASSSNPPIPSCWLRLTRPKAEEAPKVPSPAVEAYLTSWAERRHLRSYKRLVRSLESLDRAPALDANVPARKQKEIKTFLRKCRRHVKRDAVRRKLEPLYNRLFEMAQRTKSADFSFDELILGLGNARMTVEDLESGTTTSINGPLLEIRVECELAPDGALLVRPCEHTGVELNRQVLMAITSDREVLSRLHRAVSDLDVSNIAPGQPGTFASFLKRIAVEITSRGRFLSTVSSAYASFDPTRRSNHLIVTDTWAFYHRPKPSAVAARDAQALADLISKQGESSRGILPPLAALSLTHGPSAMSGLSVVRLSMTQRFTSSVKSFFGYAPTYDRPLFPLPTSDSQDRIHRLLTNGAPAVVVEGPPGCGKTHSIANIVCEYLAQGKRVLVTSKGAPALAVLRERLPECIADLVVDASVGESVGMQQLQRLVEGLADRVSRGVDQSDLCNSLAHQIQSTEKEIARIDAKLESFRRSKYDLMQNPKGIELVEKAYAVIEEAPWLASTVSEWDSTRLMDFAESVEILSSPIDSYNDVTGYTSPPSSSLLAGVSAQAGGILPNITGKTMQVVSSIPLIGSFSGARDYQEKKEYELNDIKVMGESPSKREEWNVVKSVLERDRKHWTLYESIISALIEKEDWLQEAVYDTSTQRLCFLDSFVDVLRKARQVRILQSKLLSPNDLDQFLEAQRLEAHRHSLTKRIQELDGKLVEAKVVTELSTMFSAEAQSALIQFAQLAGRAKFRSNAQASRLSARQQRHRQAYLKAFEKCVRYIPCWILTTNQVNDYLPAEFHLFDLVVLDEASQSDISALPTMLRGKQWLVVGDGKQVSPTENFTAETAIEALRASLPPSPFQDCLLPGSSFFDLVNQAFPSSRVVLTEHFRSEPNIIQFSNATYYQGRLQPLRLPTSAERMDPSLVDIYLPNGRKVGKSNEKECDAIVDMIKDLVDQQKGTRKRQRQRPKTIGVISLIGDEQSRMIRGRLLDAIGPEAYSLHDITVGEPPSFQGSERDVIFLSMVSSPGSVPTQSQLMYHQRINVALSRARDRMVLVRSINRSHIPSNEDAKAAVIDFFAAYASKSMVEEGPSTAETRTPTFAGDSSPILRRMIDNVAVTLSEKGFTVYPMGVVWEGAICVEDDSGSRAAITLENTGELKQEWSSTISQQRAIERVGWKCYRIDTLAWLLENRSAVDMILSFLRSAGVKAKKKVVHVEESLDGDNGIGNIDQPVQMEEEEEEEESVDNDGDNVPDNVVVISSNEEEEEEDDRGVGDQFMQLSDESSSEGACVKEESDDDDDDDDDGFDPSNYGSVIQLGGMSHSPEDHRDDALDSDEDEDPSKQPSPVKITGKRKRNDTAFNEESGSESESDGSDLDKKPRANRPRQASSSQQPTSKASSDEDYHGDESDDSFSSNGTDENSDESRRKKRKRRRRRRLDKHSRDGRWYPPRNEPQDDERMEVEEEEWDDLKDVISCSSTENDEDGSMTSRLRSSIDNNSHPVLYPTHVGSEENAIGVVEASPQDLGLSTGIANNQAYDVVMTNATVDPNGTSSAEECNQEEDVHVQPEPFTHVTT